MARTLASMAVPAELVEYAETTFAGDERELLERMWRRAATAGIPPIMIAVDQARFLTVLLRSLGARRAVDVGTLFGYSAAILARAMGPRGRVVSLEADARHATTARANLRAERLQGRVRVVEGPALESLRTLRAGAWDVVLIDADKENYPAYLREAVRLLRDGGLVAVDNTFAFGKVAAASLRSDDPDRANVETIRRFNAAAAARKDLDAVLLPLGDGLLVGVVRKRRR